MMVAMLLCMMASFSEIYCQFMYTKRMFQWEMDKGSSNLKTHIYVNYLNLIYI